MTRRRIVEIMNAGRALAGALLILRPRAASRWIGDGAHDDGVRVMTRGFGARDLALGAGTLMALREGAHARRWLTLCAIADGTDALAQIAGRRALPRAGALLGIASAVAAVGLDLSEASDHDD